MTIQTVKECFSGRSCQSFILFLTIKIGMHSQQQIPLKKEAPKGVKSFSNRGMSIHMQPYSHEHLKAKQKAFERYKKIYPVNDKQNLYPASKTPYIGFYVLKGYKQEPSSLRESQNINACQQSSNSDKIISNMLKRYLERKQQVQMKQHDVLPRIEHSLTLPSGTSRSSMYLKGPKRTSMRMVTQQGSRRGRESGDDDRYL